MCEEKEPRSDLCAPAAVGVKALKWVQSETGVEGECHTVPTEYKIRYDDEWGWRWSKNGAFGVEVTLSGAKAAAQADYEKRILSALVLEGKNASLNRLANTLPDPVKGFAQHAVLVFRELDA